MSTQAEVWAKTERDMVDAGATDIKRVRIVEDLRIPIRGQVVHGHLVTGADGLSADLGVDGDGPWAVLDEAGSLLAVYERQSALRVKPAVVIPPLPVLAEPGAEVENGTAE